MNVSGCSRPHPDPFAYASSGSNPCFLTSDDNNLTTTYPCPRHALSNSPLDSWGARMARGLALRLHGLKIR